MRTIKDLDSLTVGDMARAIRHFALYPEPKTIIFYEAGDMFSLNDEFAKTRIKMYGRSEFTPAEVHLIGAANPRSLIIKVLFEDEPTGYEHR